MALSKERTLSSSLLDSNVWVYSWSRRAKGFILCWEVSDDWQISKIKGWSYKVGSLQSSSMNQMTVAAKINWPDDFWMRKEITPSEGHGRVREDIEQKQVCRKWYISAKLLWRTVAISRLGLYELSSTRRWVMAKSLSWKTLQMVGSGCNGLADRLHPLWHTRRTGGKTLAASDLVSPQPVRTG